MMYSKQLQDSNNQSPAWLFEQSMSSEFTRFLLKGSEEKAEVSLSVLTNVNYSVQGTQVWAE